jgi:hypothetical protein
MGIRQFFYHQLGRSQLLAKLLLAFLMSLSYLASILFDKVQEHIVAKRLLIHFYQKEPG